MRVDDAKRTKANGGATEATPLGEALAYSIGQEDDLVAGNADIIAAIREEGRQTRETIEAASLGKNGKTALLPTVLSVVALLGMFGSYVVNTSSWAGGTSGEVKQLRKDLDEEVQERKQLATWNEKVRNNLAANGWLIDSEGNVTKIQVKGR